MRRYPWEGRPCASASFSERSSLSPCSDVDRAKSFYEKLGWRLDADFADGEDFRVLQFTPPGSPSSVIFGKNVTPATPGSAQGLYLIVSDIEAAREELRSRGLEISEAFHDAAASMRARTSRTCSGATARAVGIPTAAAIVRLRRSRIPTATGG